MHQFLVSFSATVAVIVYFGTFLFLQFAIFVFSYLHLKCQKLHNSHLSQQNTLSDDSYCTKYRIVGIHQKIVEENIRFSKCLSESIPRQRSVDDLVTRGTTPNTKMDDFLNNENMRMLTRTLKSVMYFTGSGIV